MNKNYYAILMAGGVGLMKMSSTKIEWTENADNIIAYYKENLSEPIKAFFLDISIKMEFSIDWIPFWFYDYIPIAGIFGSALLFTYLSSTNTTLFGVIKEIFVGFFQMIKKGEITDIISSLFGIVFMLVMLIVIYLISPLFVIIFPLLIVSLFCLSIYIIAVFYFLILKAIFTYVVPVILIGFLIFYYVSYRKSKENFKKIITNHKSFIKRNYRLARISIRKLVRNIKRYIKSDEMKEEINSTKQEVYWFFRLIINQYKSALIIIMAFLIILFIDYNSQGFNFSETIDHIWNKLKE